MAKIPNDIQDSGSSTSSSSTDDSTDQPDSTAETTRRPPVDDLQDPGDSGGSGGGSGGTGGTNTGGGGSTGSMPDDPVNSGPGGSDPGDTGNPGGSGGTGGSEPDQPSDPPTGGGGGGQQPPVDDLQQEEPGAGASDDPPTAEEVQQQQRTDEAFEENYDRGPRGASERISGEGGISDAGSPEDPLEGTGLEAGFGEVADTARDVEDRVTEDVDTVGGLQQEGATFGRDATADLDEEDVEVVRDGDSLTVVEARDQVDAPREPERRADPGQLRRQTTGRTPDYATARQNAIEENIRESLTESGIDPDSVDVEEAAQRRREQDEGGFLKGLSRDYQEFVAKNSDLGGDVAGQAIASSVLGPAVSREASDDVLDAVTAYVDTKTEFDVEGFEESYTESVYEGAASVGNLPAAALGARDAAGYAAEGVDAFTSGEGGEFVDQTVERAKVQAALGAAAAKENPVQTAGQLSGALAGSAVTSAGTSIALTRAGVSAGSVARGAGSTVRSGVDSGVDASGSALRRVGSKTPDVDVERNADAGLVELDDSVKQSISNAVSRPDVSAPSPSDVVGQARLTAARARQSLGSNKAQARFAVSDAAGRARDRVGSGVETVQQGAVDLGQTVREAPSVAARKLEMEAKRVGRRASSARAQAEFRASQAREVISDPPSISGGNIDVDLDSAARAAGREFELRRQQTELNLAAARATAEERVSNLADGVPSQRDLSDSAFRARERAEQRLTSARVGGELSLRSRDTPGLDIDTPDVSAPSRRDISDAAFRTRERVSRGITSARVGAEMALRSRDFETPSLENPLGGASDVTIRIGGGRSRGGDLDAEPFVADGFDTDEIFDDQPDADAEPFDGAAASGDADIDGGMGGGTGQRIVQTQRMGDDDSVDVDTRTRADADRDSGISGESAVAGTAAFGVSDPMGDVGSTEDFEPGAVPAVRDDVAGVGVDVGPADAEGVGTATDVDVADDTDVGPTPTEDTGVGLRDDTDTPTQVATTTPEDVAAVTDTPAAGTPGRRRLNVDLGGGDGSEDDLLGGEPGGKEQQLEYEALDLL